MIPKNPSDEWIEKFLDSLTYDPFDDKAKYEFSIVDDYLEFHFHPDGEYSDTSELINRIKLNSKDSSNSSFEFDSVDSFLEKYCPNNKGVSESAYEVFRENLYNQLSIRYIIPVS